MQNDNIDLAQALNIDNNFDITQKILDLKGTLLRVYYVNSLINSRMSAKVITEIMEIEERHPRNTDNLLGLVQRQIIGYNAEIVDGVDVVLVKILSGLMAIQIDRTEKILVVDVRANPSRIPDEAPNDVSIRGSRDGFVEDISTNTALVRRRIRDPRLSFELVQVGQMTKLDVAICYIAGQADENIVRTIKERLLDKGIKQVAMTDNAIVEILFKGKLNPLPYTKISERPDVLAAELCKGYIGILADTQPTATIVPIVFFDILTNVEHYKQKPCAASITRLVAFFSMFGLIVGLPLWTYFASNDLFPESLNFLNVGEEYRIPVWLQVSIIATIYHILGVAKLSAAKLFRPSLVLTATIILSSAGLQADFFAPQTLFFAVLHALLSYAINTNELQKTFVMLLYISLSSIMLFGIIGYIVTLLLLIVFVATRKVFSKPYLYPLIPLNLKQLMRYIIRFPKES